MLSLTRPTVNDIEDAFSQAINTRETGSAPTTRKSASTIRRSIFGKSLILAWLLNLLFNGSPCERLYQLHGGVLVNNQRSTRRSPTSKISLHGNRTLGSAELISQVMRARNVSHYTIPDRSDASLMSVALGATKSTRPHGLPTHKRSTTLFRHWLDCRMTWILKSNVYLSVIQSHYSIQSRSPILKGFFKEASKALDGKGWTSPNTKSSGPSASWPAG
ncbi:putative Coiled-coil domain-containing protein [Fusarium oxysporum f. sp. albedinis]|nr:putative Coiled-coil domain-containing protein [Fusarium oxysporum f. sp. albedinis]